MPEDLQDKLTDFELMLMGVMNDEDVRKVLGVTVENRLMTYWYALSKELREKLK